MSRIPNLPTVLVIDPDPIAQAHTVGAVVEHARVFSAASVSEAISQITQHRPTFILLEWNLPGDDGLALIRQIRDEPRLSRIVIACVSRERGAKEKARAFQAGADDYVVQPVATETFWYRLVLLGRKLSL